MSDTTTKTAGIKIATHEILDGASIKSFDPKMIVGMVSTDQKSLKIVALDKKVTLKEKAEIEIPNINFSGRTPTIIKSVQLKNDQANGATIVFAEMSGPLTAKVYAWIEALAAHMKNEGLVNAFFPAYQTVEPAGGTYGFMSQGKISNWKTVLDTAAQNVRLLKGDAVLFSVGNTLYTMPFSNIEKRDWKAVAKSLYTYEENIKFLGRVKDGVIPITLKKGMTYTVEVGYSAPLSKGSRAINSEGIEEAVSFLIGPIGGSDIIGAISQTGKSLLLLPATNSRSVA